VPSIRRRPIFFVSGLLGLPVCIWGWLQWHKIGWLLGVSICTYLLVVSTAEAVLATKRDIEQLRRSQPLNSTLIRSSNIGHAAAIYKPLRQNPYFRAGIMGLPFCVFEWLWKHDLRFLLGAGFFAGILISTLVSNWKRRRNATLLRIPEKEQSTHDSSEHQSS
jgi:hypothetical protein